MRRKEDRPLQKVTMLLFEGDFTRLQILHPDIGASKVVRKLIRQHLSTVDKKLETMQLTFDFMKNDTSPD